MQQSLFVVDMSVMVTMVVLADLSRRLGEALKIRPYYRTLYVTIGMVFAAFVLDAFRETLPYRVLDLVAIAMRAVAGVLGIVVCLPYWRWLFTEFFHTQH